MRKRGIYAASPFKANRMFKQAETRAPKGKLGNGNYELPKPPFEFGFCQLS
jgi:hypothetical protein